MPALCLAFFPSSTHLPSRSQQSPDYNRPRSQPASLLAAIYTTHSSRSSRKLHFYTYLVFNTLLSLPPSFYNQRGPIYHLLVFTNSLFINIIGSKGDRQRPFILNWQVFSPSYQQFNSFKLTFSVKCTKQSRIHQYQPTTFYPLHQTI